MVSFALKGRGLKKASVWGLLGMLAWLGFLPSAIQALTANKVWFEFYPGFYRVKVEYTVPALRELREAHADFKSKKKAEAFYWHLVRGGDFYLGDPGQIRFNPQAQKPTPW